MTELLASCFPALWRGKYLLVNWDGKCNIRLLMTLTNEIMDLTSGRLEKLPGNLILQYLLKSLVVLVLRRIKKKFKSKV